MERLMPNAQSVSNPKPGGRLTDKLGIANPSACGVGFILQGTLVPVVPIHDDAPASIPSGIAGGPSASHRGQEGQPGSLYPNFANTPSSITPGEAGSPSPSSRGQHNRAIALGPNDDNAPPSIPSGIAGGPTASHPGQADQPVLHPTKDPQ